MISVSERIAILGTGSMGEALLVGILASGVPSFHVIATTHSVQRATDLQQSHGVATLASAAVKNANQRAVENAEIVVLAVKPKMITQVAREISGALKPGSLVVSIAAGVTLQTLENSLPAGQKIFRAMPNTPVQVGKGVIGVSGNTATTSDDYAHIEELFAEAGSVIEVPEELQDSITAISGSGPAYIFAVAEALTGAARNVGFEGELAQRLAVETVAGAARLLEGSSLSPGELRQKVSSPNGTTVAALDVFTTYALNDAFRDAANAAKTRAGELSREFNA